MSKQAVKVVIRTRPTADFASKNLEVNPSKGQITINDDAGYKTDVRKFQFEKILHNASQDEAYESSASEIIESVVQGYNGTVLCYGQTGAGKTYSMTGSSTVYKYRGIVPRAISQVYALTSSKFDQAITIRVSYSEIYNEKIRDLLPEGGNQNDMTGDQNLQISDDGRGGAMIRGLTQHVCDSEEDALNCLFEGELNRTVRQHHLNETSSRAHTIFTLHIESRSRVESADKVVFSKLHLVDLAGSERTKKTGSEGIVLKESCFINKSLSFLEQVVLALCDRKRDHIPYRQAKLTNYLRDSLGGNCKTVMIANIWPEQRHLEETTSTLKFATRMMKITNEATVNLMMDPALQIKRYEKEIRDLKQELAMHDTLANRGRINYADYSQKEQAEIQELTSAFLNEQSDDIGDIDSLRKVREVFSCIRLQYRKTQQNIEAIKRQIDSNPDAFKKAQQAAADEESKRAESQLAEEKKGEQSIKDDKASQGEVPNGQDEAADGDADQANSRLEKEKKPAIDKQLAFQEFKGEQQGQVLENRIREKRDEVKQCRGQIKTLTNDLNAAKQDIDTLKMRLDRKEDERKIRLREEQLKQEDAFEEAAEEIIDEEELVMLKQMKDLKKAYRDSFAKLKTLKMEHVENQKQIDVIKEQLISQFEEWYAQEFDVPNAAMENAYNANLQNEFKPATTTPSEFGDSNSVDDDQAVYMRAKRKVEILAKAKRLDKQIGGRR